MVELNVDGVVLLRILSPLTVLSQYRLFALSLPQ
jgi:hypothetical protein